MAITFIEHYNANINYRNRSNAGHLQSSIDKGVIKRNLNNQHNASLIQNNEKPRLYIF